MITIPVCCDSAKATQLYDKRPIYTKRDLRKYEKRPTHEGYLHVDFAIPVCCDSAKKTQLYEKRPIHTKETNIHDYEKR